MKHKIHIFLLIILITSSGSRLSFSEPSLYENLLNMVNTENDETSCSFSGDKTVFTFTRKNAGTSNYDIYITEFKDGAWTQPETIEKINTESDEISPFLSDDGNYIFFSSNRPGSLKNTKASRPSFDLYVSERSTGSWSEPVPLYGAVNSTDDETNPYISPSLDMIYFTRTKFNDSGKSSIIEAKKENDLWGVHIQTSDLSYITSIRTYMARKSRYRSGFWVSAYRENESRRDIFFIKTDTQGNIEIIDPGESVNSVEDENTVFELSENMVLISDNNSNSGNYDILLIQIPENLIPKDQVFAEDSADGGENKVPDDKSDITDKKNDTKKIKKKKTSSACGVESVFVIDVKSEDIANLQAASLKVLLFNSVKEWSNPVEARIMSPDSDSKIEIKTGSAIKRIIIIPAGDDIEGFAAEFIIKKNETRTGSLTIKKGTNSEFKLRPVYFKFNSSEIQLQDIPYIHELLDYMRKNSTVKLSIEGYSDSRGTHKANIDISIKRAEKIRDYLAGNGIDSSRLSIKGHGFVGKEPGDTSQQNRRVDFKITE